MSLARKLYREQPGLCKSLASARDIVRHARGERNKKRPNTVKIAVAREKLPPLPPSLAKPWVPFELEARRVLVLSDLHFPFHDMPAIKAALKCGDGFRPDAVLLNGDVLDFHSISRFAKDPRGPTVKEELEICREFMRHLRQRYKKARIVYKLGNHDERWEKMLWARAPEILDIVEFSWQQVAGIGECGVEVVGDQRKVMLGKLPVLHGHELPKGISNPVNPARGAFLRTTASVLVGHSHRQSDHDERTLDERTLVARSTGCLCGLWPEYARINKWYLYT